MVQRAEMRPVGRALPAAGPFPAAAELARGVLDARRRTFALVEDLGDLLGPRLSIVNPLLWEIGHVAWFQERWVLRHALGRPPVDPRVDALYDSSAVAHDTRWDLPLLTRVEVYRYLETIRDLVAEVFAAGEPAPEVTYHAMYAVFHEDMHGEAFTYTRQTLGHPAPRLESPPFAADGDGGPLPGDVEIAGGTRSLGADPSAPFVFDNEKWAHPVPVAPFRIARAAVTQGEFAAFVEDRGYQRPELWSPEGWTWRQAAGAEGPLYWRREGAGWWRCVFARRLPLERVRPGIHVNAHEAEAFCRWAGRRLPTEAEWEAAAAGDLDGARRRRFPWGDAAPGGSLANLDGLRLGCVEVGSLAAGDTPEGCRQMLGNVWEWTATPFRPYPGFTPDPYEQYSAPWFETHRVLRGGAWPTRARLLRNTWRNYYTPDRRDVWAGFRTCALS